MWVLVFLGLIQEPSAWAAEWRSETINCAITFPETWREPVPPGGNVRALYQSADGTKTVALLVEPVASPGLTRVDPKFNEEFKRAFASGKGAVLAARDIQLAGLPAYEVLGRTALGIYSVSIVVRVVIADGRVYQLQASKTGSGVLQDAELQQCLGSFRFLQPPRSPSLTGLAEWPAALIAIGLAGLAAIGGLIFVLARRARRRRIATRSN